MSRLKAKNWVKFQHYKDRCPPWIKFHKELLDDYDFQCLPLASKALAPMIWLLASESDDGTVANDAKAIAWRLRWSVEEVQAGLTPLIEKGFLIPDSNVLADCLQDACLETETETETDIAKPLQPATQDCGRVQKASLQTDLFLKFWAAYPKKKNRGHAEKVWAKIKPSEHLADQILQAVQRAKTSVEWLKDSGQFIPYPATWLNAKGWEDEPSGPMHAPVSLHAVGAV